MGELAPGRLIAGKYRLEAQIGLGGMGEVWRARHLQLDMPVAIKFMDGQAASSPEARLRFEREAKAAAKLRSPHVVQVLDHGEDGGSHYIVMELLEGEDLSDALRRQRRLSLEEAERVLTHAAKGLRRAHEAGIVHRDLKPSNIFLARVDDEIVAKVLDFGVAKLRGPIGDIAQGEATQAGTVLGSPTYMSPEQVRGVRDLDHRTDLWSLGVIVFRMVTGEKPFDATSIGDLVVKLCVDPLPKATALDPSLPSSLDAFFDRAFARPIDQRFQSALEMAQAFREAIAAGRGLPLPNPLQDTFAGLSPGAVSSLLAQVPPPRPSGPSLTPRSSPSHTTEGALAVAQPRADATPSQPLPPISGSGSFRIPAAVSLTPASGTISAADAPAPPSAPALSASADALPRLGELSASTSGAVPSPLVGVPLAPAPPSRRVSPLVVAVGAGLGLGAAALLLLVLFTGGPTAPARPKRAAAEAPVEPAEPASAAASASASPAASASAGEVAPPPEASASAPPPVDPPPAPVPASAPAPSGSGKKQPKKRPKFGY